MGPQAEGWSRIHTRGDQGCWSEQEVRQDHWHCCRSPSQEQECGVSAAEHTEVEGVQVEDDLVPINAKKPRKGDATAEEMSKAVQLAGTKRPRAMAITADMQAFKAFQTIRQARAFKRLHGIRAKKAADAEADELSKKK